MRHLREGRKFNRTASHRKAMLANLAVSVIDKERVTTTVQKAKEARRLVERLITYGKRNTVSSIRLAGRHVQDKTVLKKLFSDIAPSYRDREGGYVRIVKTRERKGDNAEMCIMELVGRTQTGERPPVAKRSAPQKATPKKVAAAAEPVPAEEKPAAETVEENAAEAPAAEAVESSEEEAGVKAEEKAEEKPAAEAVEENAAEASTTEPVESSEQKAGEGAEEKAEK